jgi:hypothetical protein
MLNVIMLSVVMLNVIMLSVIMLNVIMLSVVAPKNGVFHFCWFKNGKVIGKNLLLGVNFSKFES